MQTLLPCAGFERSARSLDSERRGKQRVETLRRSPADLPYVWPVRPRSAAANRPRPEGD